MSEIQKGDWVEYTAGRGKSSGRVVNIADGMATIETNGGKLVNRVVSMLRKVDPGNPPPPCPPHAPCEGHTRQRAA